MDRREQIKGLVRQVLTVSFYWPNLSILLKFVHTVWHMHTFSKGHLFVRAQSLKLCFFKDCFRNISVCIGNATV